MKQSSTEQRASNDEMILASRESQTDWSGESQQEESVENPLLVFLKAMHGRWRHALILGFILAPIFAFIGYESASVKYRSSSILVVESELSALVEETIETAGIAEYDAFVAEQAQLIKDPQVLYTAFEDENLAAYAIDRPDFRQTLFKNLVVGNPRGNSFVIVSLEDEDPVFAATAVNAVVEAYEEVFAPNTEREYQQRFQKIQELVEASRAKVARLKQQRNIEARGALGGRADLDSRINENVAEIRVLETDLKALSRRLAMIREDHAVALRIEAEKDGRELDESELTPSASTRIDPEMSDLAIVDPTLPQLETRVNTARIAYEIAAIRFGPEHKGLRREKASYESAKASFDARLAAARAIWESNSGRSATWGKFKERERTVRKELEALIDTNASLEQFRITIEDITGKIGQEERELGKLQERLKNLDREKDSIRQGRVDVRAKAVAAFSPVSDKRVVMASFGFAGGWMFAILVFAMLGFKDQKTYGVSQLKDNSNRLRVLGVLPNMDDIDQDGIGISLASDCIHRVRGRIEMARAPEKGYSMMVSSPFQGDGKTTFAVSLGWSYAESGYRTLLIDADFVGRAMTHQFGHLKMPGLREVIRNTQVDDQIIELGHPNLSLLPVGFDRRVTAANLSSRMFGRVLEMIRDDYDVILVDTGPLTASIEALPIASSVDGIVFALRRGRSRARISECIKDIRAVGADYLGMVLNYATRADCETYGSTSKVSTEVRSALLDEDAVSAAPKNPLIDDLHSGSSV